MDWAARALATMIDILQSLAIILLAIGVIFNSLTLWRRG